MRSINTLTFQLECDRPHCLLESAIVTVPFPQQTPRKAHLDLTNLLGKE
jgi:hypothetical protein